MLKILICIFSIIGVLLAGGPDSSQYYGTCYIDFGGLAPRDKIGTICSAITGVFTDLSVPRERLRNALEAEDLKTDWYRNLALSGCSGGGYVYDVSCRFMQALEDSTPPSIEVSSSESNSDSSKSIGSPCFLDVGGFAPRDKIGTICSAISGTFTDLSVPREQLINALEAEDLTTDWYRSVSNFNFCGDDAYEYHIACYNLQPLEESSSESTPSSSPESSSYSSEWEIRP